MSGVLGWAVEALIASTVLMALVLLIRGAVRRQFGAQIAYSLWTLPLLRLLLPPLPAAWREAAATPISRAGETITVLVIDPAGTAAVAPVAAFPSLGLVLAALWAAGAAAFLAWHLTRHSLFCRRMLGSAEAIDAVGSIRVIATDAAPGPLAFGLVRRYVAFPRDFAERYDADERDLALAHELGHHQRGDLAANWAALAVLALHWFNPVAWRAFRAFRADQELANDARVLAGRSAIDRHSYACAIVKAAHGGVVSAACHLHTINDLKGRLKMLTTSRTSRRRLVAGGTIVSALVVAGLGLTASGTSAASAITTRVGDTIGVDLQAEPPLPPAPPAAPAPVIETVSGKPVHRIIVKRVDRDGKVTTTTTDSDADPMTSEADTDAMVKRALANAPEVDERNCPNTAAGDKRRLVLHGEKGGKKMVIICSNRIDAAAADAAAKQVDAAAIQRNAMKTAMASIDAARASIRAERSLTDAQRKEALAGLDEAVAEMRADMAKAGDD